MQQKQLEQLECEVRTFAVTNYIVNKLRKHGIYDITNLKLQKVLYIAYGLHLCLFEQRLFESEIQAWRLGPIVYDIYRGFKQCGDGIITTNATAIDPKTGEFFEPQLDADINPRALNIACTAYGQRIAWNLVDITQDENSAWKKNYINGKNGVIIPDADISIEFEAKISGIAKYFSNEEYHK